MLHVTTDTFWLDFFVKKCYFFYIGIDLCPQTFRSELVEDILLGDRHLFSLFVIVLTFLHVLLCSNHNLSKTEVKE